MEDDFESIEDIFDESTNGTLNYQKYLQESIKADKKFSFTIGDDNLIAMIRSPRLKKYAEDYKNNILLNIEEEAFRDLSEKVDAILKENDYIVENYLVNQIFKDLIPFNKGEDMMASVNVLINTYKLIKEYLKGRIYKSKERIMAEDVVSVIQAISKDLEHNKVLNKIINYKA